MEAYQLKTEQFSGPIEKLLDLIDEKKLEITELSLAEVTADFLAYLSTIPVVSPRLLADFVSVASKLLLIKSKALLPALVLTEDEEKDIKDLEGRLEFYRQFKPAQEVVRALWEQKNMSFGKPLFAHRVPVFYPSESMTIERLHTELKYYFDLLRAEYAEESTLKVAIISIEEKIEELLSRIKIVASASFQDIAKEKHKGEVVALFLAILHLMRNQLIAIEQEGHFSDIIISTKSSSGSGEGSPDSSYREEGTSHY